MVDPTNETAAAAEELVDYEEEEVAEAEAGKGGEVRRWSSCQSLMIPREETAGQHTAFYPQRSS